MPATPVPEAFDIDLMGRLVDLLERAATDEQVRACVLTGSGNCFCSGADIAFLGRIGEDLSKEFNAAMNAANRAITKIVRFPKPLLMAVNGPAMGGGTCMALAGDAVIAHEKSAFGFVFSRHNLIPDMGASFVLTRLVGSLRARDLLLSGRTFTAKEALDYGLINQVVSTEEFSKVVFAE